MLRTATYRCLRNAIDRCYNKKNNRYESYGGRGITVCDEWREDFINFYKDMGENPKGMTLDRINNDKSYCKENCRWIPAAAQARNKSTNRIIEYKGQKKSAAEWADIAGINKPAFYVRLYLGWAMERIMTEPLRYQPNRRRSNPRA